MYTSEERFQGGLRKGYLLFIESSLHLMSFIMALIEGSLFNPLVQKILSTQDAQIHYDL